MKALTSLALTVALISNCSLVQAQSAENRTVSPFTKIESNIPLDIVLEKGSKENVHVEVNGVELQKILTTVEENTLKVKMENGNYSNLKGKLTITYVSLSGISSKGSGDLTCKSDIDAADFSLNTSGSGDVTINGKTKTTSFTFHHKGSGDVTLSNLETTDLTLSMMGSGDFKALTGKAQKQTIDLLGSGDVEIAGLTGENCTVSIKGSGDVETNVSNALQGSILGSGNIEYKGEPKVKQVEVKGSGSVSKM
jgi:hypothetical protein